MSQAPGMFFFSYILFFFTNNIFYINEQVLGNTKRQPPPPPPPPSLKTQDGGGFSTSDTSTTPSLARNTRWRGFLHIRHLHYPLPRSKRETEGVSPLLTPPPPPPSLKTRDRGGFSTSNTSTTLSLAQNARWRGFITFFF